MVKGLEEMQANIQKMILENKQEAKKAVNQVAEETKELLQSNIPVSTEAGKHLKDDVALSGFKMISGGSVEKDILYKKKAGAHVFQTMEQPSNQRRILKKKR
ncbi:hypothetical protein R5O32_12245 [Listeria monocytogenes]|nr:hypothetical protein R5O32_12245 [Listeria monocytogenes]WOX34105.1 hypothetical protein R5O28_09935 [Listeria monocytogenes]